METLPIKCLIAMRNFCPMDNIPTIDKVKLINDIISRDNAVRESIGIYGIGTYGEYKSTDIQAIDRQYKICKYRLDIHNKRIDELND